MPDQRTERIALNESAFRDLNEKLESSVHSGRPPEDYAGFVCECGDYECETTLRLRLPDYEAIRADPMLFFVAPGHDAPDVEDVVDEHDGYLVVRKHEAAQEIVEETDPRR
jgi:hypothetical protein